MPRLLSLCAAFLALCGLAAEPYGDISDVKLAKPEDKVDMKTVPPPKGAVVLFDGKSLDGWVSAKTGNAAGWKLLDGGVVEVKGKEGNIVSKQKFGGHFKLHVEFRVPYLPAAKGQKRANSGVYVQGRYEVQILDSYGLMSKDNDCAAIYEVAAPTVNACKAPTVWQSFDIDFQSPQCEKGKEAPPALITVTHNGVKVHDKVKITKPNTRSGLGGDPCDPGPIMLQDHGNPVQFRNIWIVQEK